MVYRLYAEVRNEAQQEVVYIQSLYNKNDFSNMYSNGTNDFQKLQAKKIFYVDEKKKTNLRRFHNV